MFKTELIYGDVDYHCCCPKQVIMLPLQEMILFFLHHDSLEGSRDFSAGRWLFPEELKEVHVEKMGGNSSWVSFYLSPKRKALKPFAKKSTHTRYKSWWCDRAKSFWHPSSPFSSFSFSGYICVSSCVGTPKDGRQCLNYRSVCAVLEIHAPRGKSRPTSH